MTTKGERVPDAFQLFKPLPPNVEAALRASIDRFGVLVAVVKDQHGRILDGHHRSRIADDLGREYHVNVVDIADDDEAREVARTLNSDRRHLTEEQRREVIALLAGETVAVGREEVAKHSPNAIAGALGVSLDTVQRDMEQLTDVGKLARPSKTLGQDGKVRPTKRDPEPAASKPATKRQASKRRPLPAIAKDAGWALRKEVEKVERVVADDRLPENRKQVATHMSGHLLYAVEALQRALDRINSQGD